MTSEEYQAKVQTFVIYPPCFAVAYPRNGLVAEVGEFCGKCAKLMRDQAKTHDEFRALMSAPETTKELLAELGDCYWMLTALATTAGINIQDIKTGYNKGYHLSNLIEVAADIHARGPDSNNVSRAIQICDCIAHIHDSSREEVFDMNIAKLESRKARGVIAGSGDNR